MSSSDALKSLVKKEYEEEFDSLLDTGEPYCKSAFHAIDKSGTIEFTLTARLIGFKVQPPSSNPWVIVNCLGVKSGSFSEGTVRYFENEGIFKRCRPPRSGLSGLVVFSSSTKRI